jgi:hypothetical protein
MLLELLKLYAACIAYHEFGLELGFGFAAITHLIGGKKIRKEAVCIWTALKFASLGYFQSILNRRSGRI